MIVGNGPDPLGYFKAWWRGAFELAKVNEPIVMRRMTIKGLIKSLRTGLSEVES